MANLRIIADNAIDRAQLSASSTAGLLAVTNLQSDKKSNVWRSVGKTERVTATWSALEPMQAVALPFCNLSPTATMRVRVTSEAAATNLLAAPNDFTATGSWPRTSISVATGVAGPDGTNSAATLTATAASGNIYQTVSISAGSYTSSIWIRRRTGSGTISIRNAANGAWLPLTISGTWTRFANDGGSASGSAQVNLLITNSGDAIDVCFAQLEAGAMTSYYPGVRPLGYIDSWQSYAYDSGAVLACPAPAKVLRGWTAAQSASAYAYGGGAVARHWMPSSVQAYGLAVDIADANNLQGYIEAARLVAGPYWSPTYNTATLSETNVDAAVHYRTDAGDLLTDASTIHKKVPLDFQFMPAADRAALADILRGSRAYPIFVSVFPGNADLSLERAYTIYGKRTSDSDVEVQAAINYGAKIELESV
jgi:hypothetical protein